MWNKCPKCGRTTQGKEDFCVACGEPLTIICSCGAKWRYYLGYKCCPNCGKKTGKK